MANAFSAGFQRIVHRARPAPVGSSDLVTRYKHFRAGRIQPVNATPGGLSCSESSRSSASAGVRQPSLLRGLALSWAATNSR